MCLSHSIRISHRCHRWMWQTRQMDLMRTRYARSRTWMKPHRTCNTLSLREWKMCFRKNFDFIEKCERNEVTLFAGAHTIVDVHVCHFEIRGHSCRHAPAISLLLHSTAPCNSVIHSCLLQFSLLFLSISFSHIFFCLFLAWVCVCVCVVAVRYSRANSLPTINYGALRLVVVAREIHC